MSWQIGQPISLNDFRGLIFPFAGSTAPTGWLLCDGAAVSRTTYAALFALIGTTYGAGDGSTTFNVPDGRGRTIIGAGAGTFSVKFASTDVNATTDVITVPANGHLYTGTPIVLTTTGSLPSGLSLATTYYVIRLSSTTIRLASSAANALLSVPVYLDIASQGSGSNTITGLLTSRALGEAGGEESHSLSIDEMPSHEHDRIYNTAGGSSSTSDKYALMGQNGSTYGLANTTPQRYTTAWPQGGSNAHNVMSPFMTANWIIKT